MCACVCVCVRASACGAAAIDGRWQVMSGGWYVPHLTWCAESWYVMARVRVRVRVRVKAKARSVPFDSAHTSLRLASPLCFVSCATCIALLCTAPTTKG